jgi:hypothetical protein
VFVLCNGYSIQRIIALYHHGRPDLSEPSPSGAAENREEGSTNSSPSRVRLAEAKFSPEWENRSDTCEFAADLNSGRVLFPKIIGGLSDTFESTLPG